MWTKGDSERRQEESRGKSDAQVLSRQSGRHTGSGTQVTFTPRPRSGLTDGIDNGGRRSAKEGSTRAFADIPAVKS